MSAVRPLRFIAVGLVLLLSIGCTTDTGTGPDVASFPDCESATGPAPCVAPLELLVGVHLPVGFTGDLLVDAGRGGGCGEAAGPKWDYWFCSVVVGEQAQTLGGDQPILTLVQGHDESRRLVAQGPNGPAFPLDHAAGRVTLLPGAVRQFRFYLDGEQVGSQTEEP